MELNLKDKSVIVTGGGSNIGRAIASPSPARART